MQGSATTSLDVLNLALSTLGKDHCDSFDPALGIEPESLEGKKVARLFNKAIDDVQREFYWHELITAKAIAADAQKSHDGRYRYALPGDCIRPLGVRLPSDGETLIPTAYTRLVAQDSEYDYDIEGGFLLTGAASPLPDAMVVEDPEGGTAGSPVVLGTYRRDGDSNGFPAYTLAGGVRLTDSISVEVGSWIVKNGVSEYYVSSDTPATPDLATGWFSDGSGIDPVPTVRRATWADIDAAGIDRTTVPLLAGTGTEIVYLRRAASPADWTSELLDCIVAKLAADAALSVTGKYRLTQALKADYRMTIRSEAKRLQSKYKTNETRMPRGFGAWRANRG